MDLSSRYDFVFGNIFVYNAHDSDFHGTDCIFFNDSCTLQALHLGGGGALMAVLVPFYAELINKLLEDAPVSVPVPVV